MDRFVNRASILFWMGALIFATAIVGCKSPRDFPLSTDGGDASSTPVFGNTGGAGGRAAIGDSGGGVGSGAASAGTGGAVMGSGGAVGGRGSGGAVAGSGGTIGGTGGASGGSLGQMCSSTQHNCAGTCVDNNSPLHCGGLCDACVSPSGGTATCDGTRCDFTCGALKKCSAKCTFGCCLDADCPAQAGMAGQCDTSTNVCNYACAVGFKPCGAGNCIPMANCCAESDCAGACKTCSPTGACVSVVGADDPDSCPGTCDSTGACRSKRGQTCMTGNGCITGTTCAPDGYCCNTACTNSCQACDIPGFLGTCTPLASGNPHGNRLACVGTGTSCAGSCADKPDGSCAYPTSACGPASCTGGIMRSATSCNGSGQCPAPAMTTCVSGCNATGTDCLTCGAGQAVCNGTCCLAGQGCCGGVCQDLNTTAHCGTCTMTCSPAETSRCEAGMCKSRFTAFPVLTPNSVPNLIVLGPDGNLWFTESFGGVSQIGRITPSGTVTEFKVSAGPGGITAGPDGNVWFTEGARIGRITPAGVITDFPVLTGTGSPAAITAGPDGNLWFTDQATNKIGRITPTGVVTEFPIPTSGRNLGGITSGSDGNLWFTEGAGNGINNIGRITPAGVVTEFPAAANSAIFLIAGGPDGNVWFTEAFGNKIGRITPLGVITEFPLPTGGFQPTGITTGPDGNVWFVFLNTTNAIARITLNGVITVFSTAVPISIANGSGIATGPDRNLWFPEGDSNEIYQFIPP